MTTAAEKLGPAATTGLRARWALRHATCVGAGARIVGHPVIRSDGTIRVGARATFVNAPNPIQFSVAQGGSLEIADEVNIGPGVLIAAQGRIRIGRGVTIGAHTQLLDDDSRLGIVIHDGASIGEQVRLLSGTVIGEGSRVERGSVVTGNVPPGMIVTLSGMKHSDAALALSRSGARPPDDATTDSVRALLAKRLPAAASADGDADLQALSDFDSLALVHWLVALEERYGVSLDPAVLAAAHSFNDVARLIKAARKSGQADPSGEVSEADRANSYGESTAAPNGDGTQRSTLTEELQAIRQHVHRYRLWLALANALPRWTMGRLRTLLFRLAGCRIPHGSRFLGRAWLIGPGYAAARLSVGTGCLIGHDVTFGLDGEISLGRNVSVGPYCRLYTATHRIGAHRRRMDPLVLARTIVVEDGVWIGMGALILPGVRLGAGSVVSAGAVVTRDVPPDTLVAGNPAIVVEALGGDS